MITAQYFSLVSGKGGRVGRKDIGLKTYFRDSVRYADLWNGGVFQGRQVLKAEELQEITPVYAKADRDAVLERAGDLVMMQSRKGERYAILAMEHQEKIDYSMPARIMIQEALAYDRQLKKIRLRNERSYMRFRRMAEETASDGIYRDDGEYLYKFRKEDRLFPVVTLVVYWGDEKWRGAKSLHEMMDFGDVPAGSELKKLVPEYPLHFLDLSNFRHLEYFQTELRPLFGLFQRRKNRTELADYIRENEKSWNMDDESWYMLGEMIGSGKIQDFIWKKDEKKEDGKMGNALDELIEEWVEERTEKRVEQRIAESLEQRVEEQLEQRIEERLEQRVEERLEQRVEERAAKEKAESVIDILEEYGAVPVSLRQTILNQADPSILRSWIKLAVRTGSVGEFARQSSLG